MKRTTPWAVFAFFPLVALILVTALESESSAYLLTLGAKYVAVAFLLKYWWAILFAAISAQFLFFCVTAVRNRGLNAAIRALWVVTIFLFGPLAAPMYWWLNSARDD